MLNRVDQNKSKKYKRNIPQRTQSKELDCGLSEFAMLRRFRRCNCYIYISVLFIFSHDNQQTTENSPALDAGSCDSSIYLLQKKTEKKLDQICRDKDSSIENYRELELEERSNEQNFIFNLFF